jgi:hypothetical protein
MIDSSLSVSVTTLDTTSHDFTFQTFQFGEHSSSVFNDVAIIDENNIWAVGEVYMRDSAGQADPIPFNVARWDGTSWNLLRVMFPGVCGQPGTFPTTPSAVFSFGSSDVWIVSGAFVARWNGSTFAMLCIPDTLLSGLINELWGTSPVNVYAVGYGGTIVHYNGSSWQRIESGTTLTIYDVLGARNARTGEYEILCVASNHGLAVGRKVLKIQGLTVTEMPDAGLPWSIDEVWFTPDRRYIIVGDGMYEVNRLGDVWSRNTALPTLYKEAIDGTRFNDIVVGGAFWLLAHYNGVTWRTYFPVASGGFGSVAVRGNLIAAAGLVGSRALVVLGRR